MSRFRTLAVTLCAAAVATAGPVRAEPLKIRAAYVIAPAEILPMMLLAPGAAQHEGKSYTLETTRIGASSQQITAIAAGQIDLAALNYSSTPLAIINAHLEDLRIICGEIEDGHPGYYSATYWVRKNSGIHKVEELKGKTLATNGFGTGTEMAMKIVLKNHGLDPATDAHIVEVPFPAQAAALMEGKVDLDEPPTAFTSNPKFQAVARPLFEMRDAFGKSYLSFLTARAGFIEAHRAALVDFLEDYLRAVRWFENPQNNDQAIAIASKFTHIPAKVFKGWAFGKGDFYRDPDGNVDMKALQSNVNDAARLHVIPKSIEMSKYADLSLVKEAAARLNK